MSLQEDNIRSLIQSLLLEDSNNGDHHHHQQSTNDLINSFSFTDDDNNLGNNNGQYGKTNQYGKSIGEYDSCLLNRNLNNCAQQHDTSDNYFLPHFREPSQKFLPDNLSTNSSDSYWNSLSGCGNGGGGIGGKLDLLSNSTTPSLNALLSTIAKNQPLNNNNSNKISASSILSDETTSSLALSPTTIATSSSTSNSNTSNFDSLLSNDKAFTYGQIFNPTIKLPNINDNHIDQSAVTSSKLSLFGNYSSSSTSTHTTSNLIPSHSFTTQQNTTNLADAVSPLYKREKFESQMVKIANEINTTIQWHMTGLQNRKEQLLKQLENVKKIYSSMFKSDLGALIDSDISIPLPLITFTKPDQALYKAVSSLGFLTTPAFAPFCVATGDGLESAVIGVNTSFTIVTKNCFNEELLVGRESIVVKIVAVNNAVNANNQGQLELNSGGGSNNNSSSSLINSVGYGSKVVGDIGNNVNSTGNSFSNGIMMIPYNLLDHNNGKYIVSYTVSTLRYVPQELVISILVNGLPLVDSPYRVPVHMEQRQRWQHVLTFGSEGNAVGQLCRPWGVAIVRMPPQVLSMKLNGQLNGDNQQHQQQQQQQPQQQQQRSQSSSNLNGGSTPPAISLSLQPSSYSCFSSSSSSSSSCSNDASSSSATTNLTGSNNSTKVQNDNNINFNKINGNCNYSKHYLITVADRSNNRIQMLDFDTITQEISVIHVFGSGPGTRAGFFDRPAGICINTSLNHIIVADKDNHRIQVFDYSGRYLFKFGEKGNRAGQFCYPWDIASCPSSHQVLVSDTRNRRVQLFTPYGQYITHFAQIDSPRGVAFLGERKIVVSDFNKHRLVVFDKHGGKEESSKTIGYGEGTGWGEFMRPQGISICGNNIFCSDSRNDRICIYNLLTQSFEYISEDLGLDRPSDLDVVDNMLVIVDFGKTRIHLCIR